MSEEQILDKQEQDVYSYHTFLFPFVWEKDKKDFCDFLNNPTISYWDKYVHPIFEDHLDGFVDGRLNSDYEEARFNYGVYQYFNEPARKAIYGNVDFDKPATDKEKAGNDGVQNYRFRSKELAGKHGQDAPFYEIDCTVKRIKQGEEVEIRKTYRLFINNITLRLYPVGIGILVYELENKDYRTLEDFKDINEFGRRIQLASLQVNHDVPLPKREKDKNFKLTAHRIRVCGMEEDFSERVERFAADKKQEKNPWKEGRKHLSDTILKLFGRNDETEEVMVTLKKEEAKEGKFFIEPGVDDRMFVFSLLSDGKVLPGGEYNGLEDLEGRGQITLKNLYELIYVDPAHGLTCQSRKRLKEELESSIYDRWMEKGTLYGVTQYSMICVTGPHKYTEASVINPFLTIYKEMVQLVMVQRAAITMFAAKAADLSGESQDGKEGVAERILEMQKDYVAFQNQILLFDVTAQLQGTQLYKMLQDKMEIAKQEQEMEKQLQNLYEISQTESAEQTNSILNIMAVFGLVYTGIQMLQTQIVEGDWFSKFDLYGAVFCAFAILLILITFYERKQLDPARNKKKKRSGIGKIIEKGFPVFLLILFGVLTILGIEAASDVFGGFLRKLL